jgi:hypothetical protein
LPDARRLRAIKSNPVTFFEKRKASGGIRSCGPMGARPNMAELHAYFSEYRGETLF